MAEDPDTWARAVASRVSARVISSASEAEAVVAHRATLARERRQRERATEARDLAAALAGASTPGPPESSAPPGAPAWPALAPAASEEALQQVRHLAAALTDARRQEDSARQRLADAAGEAEASQRVQASLEAAPDQLREASAAVLHTAEQARALTEALGARPVYDPAVHASIGETKDAFEDASDHYDFLRRRSTPLIAIAVGLALVGLSLHLTAPALGAIVVVLVLALGFFFRRLLATRRRAKTSREELAAALTEAGVERADQLDQRQIEAEAWERRAKEAAVADEAWAEASRHWQALAGPEAQPDQVDQVIADLQRAQQVHERMSAGGSAHVVVDQGVGRLEEEWRRVMARLGLDVPPAEPYRALDVLATRAGAAGIAGQAPLPGSVSGAWSGSVVSAEDQDRARVRLADLLEGRSLEQVLQGLAALGPERDYDDRPLLLADPLRTLSGERKIALLVEFERLSRLSPVVLVTADPEIQGWAASR